MRTLTHTAALFSLVFAVACGTEEDPIDNTPDSGVTYADVEPILAANCTNCHGVTPSNGAPTSFASYADASSRIAGIMRRGVDGDPGPMPPSGLTLTDDDVEILLDWQAAGTPE